MLAVPDSAASVSPGQCQAGLLKFDRHSPNLLQHWPFGQHLPPLAAPQAPPRLQVQVQGWGWEKAWVMQQVLATAMQVLATRGRPPCTARWRPSRSTDWRH